MKFEFSITVPEDLTETHRRFIMDRMQDEARYIHKLLWPGKDYVTEAAFVEEKDVEMPEARQLKTRSEGGSQYCEYPFEDLQFGSIDDARKVMQAVSDLFDRYDSVTVADLLDLTGMASTAPDHNYGWKTLASFAIFNNHPGPGAIIHAVDPERL